MGLAALQDKPDLFSTFLMWLLADLFQDLPEVGDVERPKLVFFLDEAHLLFDDASEAFLDARRAQTSRRRPPFSAVTVVCSSGRPNCSTSRYSGWAVTARYGRVPEFPVVRPSSSAGPDFCGAVLPGAKKPVMLNCTAARPEGLAKRKQDRRSVQRLCKPPLGAV